LGAVDDTAAPPELANLLDKCRPIISEAVPTIDLPDDELAAVTAAIRRAIEDDKFPHAPRLDPLRAALVRLEAGANAPLVEKKASQNKGEKPNGGANAPPTAKADKRARSAKASAPKISPGFKLGRPPPDR
jgi:hypothetical protein